LLYGSFFGEFTPPRLVVGHGALLTEATLLWIQISDCSQLTILKLPSGFNVQLSGEAEVLKPPATKALPSPAGRFFMFGIRTLQLLT
jgi:hypothetical protein